jgi:hypothetical protein
MATLSSFYLALYRALLFLFQITPYYTIFMEIVGSSSYQDLHIKICSAMNISLRY